MGLAVFHRFNMLVNLGRNNPSLAGDVAANHQHHTELTDRVRKTQYSCGQETRASQWQCNREKLTNGAGAQRRGNFKGPSTDGLKGMLQGLHGEGQLKNDRSNDQPREAKGQPSHTPFAKPSTDEALGTQEG